MTARGPPDPKLIPKLPGPDPSLKTRPVPWERHFHVRSFGPGADPDIRKQVRSLEELDQELADSGFQGPIRDPKENCDAVTRDTLRAIIDEVAGNYCREDPDFGPSPTWGVYILVTAYSDSAQRNLEIAVHKLVETVRRYFLARSTQLFAAYGEEASKRFKLSVIQDKDALEDASDDRVREEFNAHVRSLDLVAYEPEQERDRDGLNRRFAPFSLSLCIVLDEVKIEELSALSFPDDLEKDRETLAEVTVKVVDRLWRYPNEPDLKGGYTPLNLRFPTGIDQCPIYDLPLIYRELGWHMVISEMFPLSEYVDTSV